MQLVQSENLIPTALDLAQSNVCVSKSVDWVVIPRIIFTEIIHVRKWGTVRICFTELEFIAILLLLSSKHSLSFFFVSLFYYKIFSLSEKAIKIMLLKVIVSVNLLRKSSPLELFNIRTFKKMQWFPLHRAAEICNDILLKTSNHRTAREELPFFCYHYLQCRA